MRSVVYRTYDSTHVLNMYSCIVLIMNLTKHALRSLGLAINNFLCTTFKRQGYA